MRQAWRTCRQAEAATDSYQPVVKLRVRKRSFGSPSRSVSTETRISLEGNEICSISRKNSNSTTRIG
jgi:hypothetical protein